MQTSNLTKKQALTLRDELRAQGKNAKAFKEVQTYTQPFKGVTVSITYFVQVV